MHVICDIVWVERVVLTGLKEEECMQSWFHNGCWYDQEKAFLQSLLAFKGHSTSFYISFVEADFPLLI